MNIAKLLYMPCNVSLILYFICLCERFIKLHALLAQHHRNLNVTCCILHVIVGSVITHEIIV